MDITVNKAQLRLATLWGIGAAIVSGILIWESPLARVFGSMAVHDAWQWFLALITPFLALILTTVVAEASRANPSQAKSSNLAFSSALWLSVFYLVAIACALLAAAWISDPPVGALKTSSLWLTPLQAMVSIALGVFFTQSRRQPERS